MELALVALFDGLVGGGVRGWWVHTASLSYQYALIFADVFCLASRVSWDRKLDGKRFDKCCEVV